VTPNFPEECRFVLERFRKVYVNDARAREQNITAEERLTFHQTHSGPVMEQLKVWLRAQFEEKRSAAPQDRSRTRVAAGSLGPAGNGLLATLQERVGRPVPTWKCPGLSVSFDACLSKA